MVKFFEINQNWQQRKKMVGPTWFVIIAYFGSTNLYKNDDETKQM
jgi:Mn2+/Fe2+ NRAMP family transporter